MRQHFKLEEVKTELLVVGGGLAGCWATLKAKELIDNILLVDKGFVARSGQTIFAGSPQYPKRESLAYISLLFPEDDLNLWLKEIIELGEYLNDQEWAKVQLEESYGQAMELEKIGESYGLKLFEKDREGKLHRQKIFQNVNTSTSYVNALAMMEVLRKRIVKQKTPLLERVIVTDLIVDGGRVVGAIGLDYRRGKLYLFKAGAVVLAGAGCGFKTYLMGTMNLTGEAQAMAYNAGAVLRNMEQAGSVIAPNRVVESLAITRSMNYGARLVNANGEEFLTKHDPLRRTWRVKRGIFVAKELQQGNGPIYLDLSGVTPEGRRALEADIPETLKAFRKVGIDPFREKIEVGPTFIGSNAQSGGIDVDSKCATNLPGLYAIGDSSCCPVQGTWSVNGINLTFCLVSGARAAHFATEYVKAEGASSNWEGIKGEVKTKVEALVAPLDRDGGLSPDEAIYRLQEVILPVQVCLLREEGRLQSALKKLEEVEQEMLPKLRARDPHELLKAIEVRSMVTIGGLILKSALHRTESRGFHYREDYPFTDNIDWLKWVKMSKSHGLWTDPVPTPYVKPPKERLWVWKE